MGICRIMGMFSKMDALYVRDTKFTAKLRKIW